MTKTFHAVVWIDHHEARVFHFDRTEVDRLVIRPDHPSRHIHHKAGTIGSGHAKESKDYYHRVSMALADAQAILITGPANAKDELVKHLQAHDPQVARHIQGVETVDHPSDNALVAHARTYFRDDHQTMPRS